MIGKRLVDMTIRHRHSHEPKTDPLSTLSPDCHANSRSSSITEKEVDAITQERLVVKAQAQKTSSAFEDFVAWRGKTGMLLPIVSIPVFLLILHLLLHYL